MHHQTPLLAVLLSLLSAVLQVSPGFISARHWKAAEAMRKQKPHSSGTASPLSQKGINGDSTVGPLTGSSLPTTCQAHAPCTLADKVLQVQGNHPNAEGLYQWL